MYVHARRVLRLISEFGILTDMGTHEKVSGLYWLHFEHCSGSPCGSEKVSHACIEICYFFEDGHEGPAHGIRL